MKCAYLIILGLVISIAANAQIITTIAGKETGGNTGDGGQATNASIYVQGLAADKWGNIYICDVFNNVIRKITPDGIISRFTGGPVHGFSGDGGPANLAQIDLSFSGIVGIATDTAGNLFFTDSYRIRKVNSAGIISTVAGIGTFGYSGDNGPATLAEFESPLAVCLDKFGNLYISDYESNTIRKVNTSGIITTYAGSTIGYGGDGGPATNAKINKPVGIACDDTGNLYVADAGNRRVRKVSPGGIITTCAGGNTGGSYACNGCSATSMELAGPSGVFADNKGYLHITTATNDVLHRVINGLSYITSGGGSAGFGGDGGPADLAWLNNPGMISVDDKGNILIADRDNYRIRKVWSVTNSTPGIPFAAPSFSVYPNPATGGSITCALTAAATVAARYVVTDILGRQVYLADGYTNTPTIIPLAVPAGVYFVSAATAAGHYTMAVTVQ